MRIYIYILRHRKFMYAIIVKLNKKIFRQFSVKKMQFSIRIKITVVSKLCSCGIAFVGPKNWVTLPLGLDNELDLVEGQGGGANGGEGTVINCAKRGAVDDGY